MKFYKYKMAEYEVIDKLTGKELINVETANDETGTYTVAYFDNEKSLWVLEDRKGDIAIVRRVHTHELILDKCAFMWIGNEQKMIDHYKCIHCFRWIFKARETGKQISFNDNLRGVEIKD